MSKMTESEELKGENISEIGKSVTLLFGIDIPAPVLRKILILIAKELNENGEKLFELNNDDSFWIKKFVFSDFDETIQASENNFKRIQEFSFSKAPSKKHPLPVFCSDNRTIGQRLLCK